MILLWIVFAIALVFAAVVAVGAPYVPSKPKDLSDAFDALYPISKKDLVLDIGSGDGIVLREVARRGGRAVGIEINPILVLISKWLSRGDLLVHIQLANLWRFNFPTSTTLVYVFGESRDIARMSRKIQSEVNRLGHDVQVMSYGFEIPGAKQLARTKTHFLYKFSPLQK